MCFAANRRKNQARNTQGAHRSLGVTDHNSRAIAHPSPDMFGGKESKS
jgi:hypothetical protein